MTKFPWKLKYMAKYILKAFFLTTFPSTQKNVQKSMLLHRCCPLRRCETPPSPPAPDPVGIENCKQIYSPLLVFTTQKIATHRTDIISAVCVAFLWSQMQAVIKKVVCSFWYRPRYFACSFFPVTISDRVNKFLKRSNSCSREKEQSED